MRARGLKLIGMEKNVLFAIVAPHAGAWIETFQGIEEIDKLAGRAPCGRVD